MRHKVFFLLAVIFLTNCSTTRLVDSWRSQDHPNYRPKKVLIVGLTENITGRRLFEDQLKDELKARRIDADVSYHVFNSDFLNTKQSEEDINKEVENLLKDGYDSVLVSAVKGVDEKTSYSGDQMNTMYNWRRFGRYYYLSQDVYFTEGYYSQYKVYSIEASLFNIDNKNDKALVWVASFQMVDPSDIENSVNDYVNAIIKSLEKEDLIPGN